MSPTRQPAEPALMRRPATGSAGGGFGNRPVAPRIGRPGVGTTGGGAPRGRAAAPTGGSCGQPGDRPAWESSGRCVAGHAGTPIRCDRDNRMRDRTAASPANRTAACSARPGPGSRPARRRRRLAARQPRAPPPAARSRAARSRTIAHRRHPRRRRARPRAVRERHAGSEAAFRDDVEARRNISSLSVGNPAIRSAPIAMSGRKRAARAADAIASARRVPPLHPLEDQIVAGLQRQVQMRHQPRLLGDQAVHERSSISLGSSEDSRSRGSSGTACRDRADHVAERAAAGQIAAVGRQVDPGQHDLADSRCRPGARACSTIRPAAHASATARGEGDDAEGAAAIAALLDLHEGARPVARIHRSDAAPSRSRRPRFVDENFSSSSSPPPRRSCTISRHCRSPGGSRF